MSTESRTESPRFSIEALRQRAEKTASTAPRCALSPGAVARPEACTCGGKGFVVKGRGGYAHAELCACVATCPACFGKSRVTQGNDSKPCREPAPHVTCNLINAAKIPSRYAEATLASFNNNTGNGRAFLQWLLRWRKAYKPVGGRGLVITGPIGVGKTYLLAALARDFAEQGLSVRFTDFFTLVGDLKVGFEDRKAEGSQLQPLIEVDVLLVDELGKGRTNEFELAIVDQLVHERYKQSKSIVATTNYSFEDVALTQHSLTAPSGFAADSGPLKARVGARVFSRLVDSCEMQELSGADYRKLKR